MELACLRGHCYSQSVLRGIIRIAAPRAVILREDHRPFFLSWNHMQTVGSLREWLALHPDRVGKVDRGVLVSARPPYASVRLAPPPNLPSRRHCATSIDTDFLDADPTRLHN